MCDGLLTKLRNIANDGEFARATKRLLAANEQIGGKLLTDVDVLLIDIETERRLEVLRKTTLKP